MIVKYFINLPCSLVFLLQTICFMLIFAQDLSDLGDKNIISGTVVSTEMVKPEDELVDFETQSEESTGKPSDGQSDDKPEACDPADFCVNENGELVMNGVQVIEGRDEIQDPKAKRSRFDATSMIKDARLGFICKRIQTPIIPWRKVKQHVVSTESIEESLVHVGGETLLNLKCRRDKSKDSGSIYPRVVVSTNLVKFKTKQMLSNQ